MSFEQVENDLLERTEDVPMLQAGEICNECQQFVEPMQDYLHISCAYCGDYFSTNIETATLCEQCSFNYSICSCCENDLIDKADAEKLIE